MQRVTRADRAARLLALCVGLLLSFSSAPTRAESPLAIEDELEGPWLGAHLEVLEDRARSLTVEAVAHGPAAKRFVPVVFDAPSYGLTDSAYWFRFTVERRAATAQRWLLEIAYPHLDAIELYVARPDGGFERRNAGDALPFAEREFNFPNFVFKLKEEPASRRTYYLRVRSTGAVSVPMRAWTYDAFVGHEGRELPLLWMFYGIVLVMAAYNLFIYVSVKQREYLFYVLYNVSVVFCQFTLSGHTFQHLVPDWPWLANHLLLFGIQMTFVWTTLFQRSFLRVSESLAGWAQLMHWQAAFCVLALPLCFLLPYRFALRLITAEMLFLMATSVAVSTQLVFRGQRTAKFYALSWTGLIAGVLLYILKTLGVIPGSFLLEWAIQIGASLEVVLLSLALADRINTLGASMTQLNGQLSQKLSELQHALGRAEEATRAKSEFLAIMSHELRTPLNAIINVPQGLIAAFAEQHLALCSACESVFELDPEDGAVTAESRCPECQATGCMHEEHATRYIGTPEHTIRHLRLVERSGKHLLQMVNSVLDFSKIDAGGLKLRLEEVPVLSTVEEAIETVAELGRSAGLEIERECMVAATDVLRGDALRLKQVLINLIGNAIKFSNGRGSVTVSVSKEHGDYLFRVRDRGIGIALEDREKIFERFEQVERGDTRRYGGTGLGLSISRSLVQLHGGEIWVESELGVGSTFAFRIPAAGPVLERPALSMPSLQAPLRAPSHAAATELSP